MMPFLISHSNTTRNKCLTRPNKSYHVQKCWHFRHFPTIMYVLCICILYVLVYVCTSGSNWKPEPDISVNFVMLWHLINTRLHVPNCLTSFDVKPKEITQPSGFLKAFEFEIRENQCVAQTNSYLFQLIHSIPFMKVSNCFGLRCVCEWVSECSCECEYFQWNIFSWGTNNQYYQESRKLKKEKLTWAKTYAQNSETLFSCWIFISILLWLLTLGKNETKNIYMYNKGWCTPKGDVGHGFQLWITKIPNDIYDGIRRALTQRPNILGTVSHPIGINRKSFSIQFDVLSGTKFDSSIYFPNACCWIIYLFVCLS